MQGRFFVFAFLAVFTLCLVESCINKKDKTQNNIKELNQEDQMLYLEKGLGYTMATKGVLMKNLMDAIQLKGTENAVAFCNTKAIFLTDSMSQSLGTSIKRVSDKPRNSLNQASSEELEIIENFKTMLYNKEKIPPLIVEKEKTVVGYYSIETNTMCLQCHGSIANDISPSTLKVIDELYPQDKARGYSENQLRGMWVVKMNKK